MTTTLPDALVGLLRVRVGETPVRELCSIVAGIVVETCAPVAGAAVAVVPADGTDVVLAGIPDTWWDTLGGPCPSVLSDDRQLLTGGGVSSGPGLALRAGQPGITDLIATSLHLRGQGCLSAYSTGGRFGHQDAVALSVVAEHVAPLLDTAMELDATHRKVEQLEEGLRSRGTISLAKGILMHQERCSEAHAFRLLVRTSQRLDRKVRAVAEHVVALAEARGAARET